MISHKLFALFILMAVALTGCESKKKNKKQSPSQASHMINNEDQSKEVGFMDNNEFLPEPVEIDIIDLGDTSDYEQKGLDFSDSDDEYISFEEETIYFE